MKSVNLKDGMPLVHQALSRLGGELALARQQGFRLVKLIHGYGSTGAGGEIRIAVQKRLRELSDQEEIRACIFGENWSKSDADAWRLIKAHSELIHDRDFGKKNLGITIVVL